MFSVEDKFKFPGGMMPGVIAIVELAIIVSDCCIAPLGTSGSVSDIRELLMEKVVPVFSQDNTRLSLHSRKVQSLGSTVLRVPISLAPCFKLHLLSPSKILATHMI